MGKRTAPPSKDIPPHDVQLKSQQNRPQTAAFALRVSYKGTENTEVRIAPTVSFSAAIEPRGMRRTPRVLTQNIPGLERAAAAATLPCVAVPHAVAHTRLGGRRGFAVPVGIGDEDGRVCEITRIDGDEGFVDAMAVYARRTSPCLPMSN